MLVFKLFFLWFRDDFVIEQFIVDEDGGWRDFIQIGVYMIYCYLFVLLEVVCLVEIEKWLFGWLEKWQFVNEWFCSYLKVVDMDDLLFEGNVYCQFQYFVFEGSLIFVGNSMLICDVDIFFEK